MTDVQIIATAAITALGLVLGFLERRHRLELPAPAAPNRAGTAPPAPALDPVGGSGTIA